MKVIICPCKNLLENYLFKTKTKNAEIIYGCAVSCTPEMKLFTIQEKIIAINLIAEMLQVLEDYEDIEELKKLLQEKMNKLALLL